jgi:hypothetical protein
LTHADTKKTSIDEPLWTPAQVAEYLGCLEKDGSPSLNQLNQLIFADPNMPKPKKLGTGDRRNRFEPQEIRDYRANLRRAGEGKPTFKKDGTPAAKRGRKPKAVLG